MSNLRSNEDVAKGVARMILALGRRARMGDPEDLALVLALHEVVDQAAQDAVDGMRENLWTWRGIAEATGKTREAAYMRWGKQPAHVHGNALGGRIET